MRVLVTGTAGFIGSYLAKALLERGDEVIGIDNINDYYEVSLKYARLAEMGIEATEITYAKPVDSDKYGQYTFIKLDICDTLGMQTLFETYEFEAVCHLAAQAGVRYSLTHPDAYIDSNIKGFLNVLECCRYNRIRHLVYASSSSVYGLNKEMPFSTDQQTDLPVSLYAASKKSKSSWHMLTVTCSGFPLLLFGFLPFMVHGADQTWPYFFSPGPLRKGRPFRSLTMVK